MKGALVFYSYIISSAQCTVHFKDIKLYVEALYVGPLSQSPGFNPPPSP